jgi:hypothetical protein
MNNSKKLTDLMRGIYPIWYKKHSFHIMKNDKHHLHNIKDFMDSHNFLSDFENKKKFTAREILYIILNTLNNNLPDELHRDIDE